MFDIDTVKNLNTLLIDICAEQNITYNTICKEIDNVNFNDLTKRDFKKWSNTMIIDEIILNQHNYIKEKANYFSKNSQKIFHKWGKKYSFLEDFNTHLCNMFEDLETHVNKEEKILFPAIKHLEKDINNNQNPLSNSLMAMLHNHDEIEKDIEFLEKITDNFRTDFFEEKELIAYYNDIKNLIVSLRQHVFIEDNILFKRALGV